MNAKERYEMPFCNTNDSVNKVNNDGLFTARSCTLYVRLPNKTHIDQISILVVSKVSFVSVVRYLDRYVNGTMQVIWRRQKPKWYL